MNTTSPPENRNSAPAELFTKAEAAAYLKIKIRTLDGWRAAKTLPWIEHGRFIRFRRADLDAFLAAHTVEAGATTVAGAAAGDHNHDRNQ